MPRLERGVYAPSSYLDFYGCYWPQPSDVSPVLSCSLSKHEQSRFRDGRWDVRSLVLGVEGRLLSQPQAGLPSFEVKQAAHL